MCSTSPKKSSVPGSTTGRKRRRTGATRPSRQALTRRYRVERGRRFDRLSFVRQRHLRICTTYTRRWAVRQAFRPTARIEKTRHSGRRRFTRNPRPSFRKKSCVSRQALPSRRGRLVHFTRPTRRRVDLRSTTSGCRGVMMKRTSSSLGSSTKHSHSLTARWSVLLRPAISTTTRCSCIVNAAFRGVRRS